METLTLLLQLAWTFLVIGAFTFGGGYAMLSLIQNQVVVEHPWISEGQFADIVAVSQMTPGPIGINSATYVGYQVLLGASGSPLLGVLGSLVATLALILPSFVIMLLIVSPIWASISFPSSVCRYLFNSANSPVIVASPSVNGPEKALSISFLNVSHSDDIF